MKLIIGGRASGKRAVALSLYGARAARVRPEEALSAPCIDCFHEVIRQVLADGGAADDYVGRLIAANPDAIVLCDEVGQGIVPLDRQQRAWREAVGRACCRLAAQSDEVLRVVCGLVQRLK